MEMTSDDNNCPICKLPNQTISANNDYGDKTTYKCMRCGTFTISGTAKFVRKNQPALSELSAWLRERNLLQIEIPLLTSNFLEEIKNTLPKYTPLEKQSKLLKAIEKLTAYPGSEVILIPEESCSLAWAQNENEFKFYLRSLLDRGLIASISKTQLLSDTSYLVFITAKGWEYLDKDQSDLESKSQVFVAMSFSQEMRVIYDAAIGPAISSAGYSPYRVDSAPHLDRIDAKIISEIKNSRFVVADVTQQKTGVYYEAGFAHGFGIPVLWCVRKDDLSNVHFDTRQYNHIVWETHEELKEQLENFILAIIGKRKK